MGLKSCIVVSKLFILLLVIFFVNGRAIAQPQAGSPQQAGGQQSVEAGIERLHLNMFEAAMGDLSLCKDDEICLRYARRIKSWLCAASACEEKNKEVRDCFGEVPKGIESEIDTLVCPMVLSPSDKTRQAILDATSEITADELAQYGAYILSVKTGAGSCQDYIKNYLQAQSLNGSVEWDRVLSGCRILSNTTTREQEEAEFRIRFSTITEIPPASPAPVHDQQ